MEDELWRPVPYEPFSKAYEVSNWGRVRPTVISRYSKNRAPFLKPSPGTRGYLHVSLYADKQRRSAFIHRMVALAFLPEPASAALVVCHKDDIQTNNHAANLEWGTDKYNAFTRETIGKSSRGTGNGHSRLTESDVREIRAMAASGVTYAVIAARFGGALSNISHVVARRTWAHIA